MAQPGGKGGDPNGMMSAMSLQVAQAQMQAMQAMRSGMPGAYPGGVMYPPPYPQAGAGAWAGGFGGGKGGSKGDGAGKGFGKGKGKGKGKSKGKNFNSEGFNNITEFDSSDPRKAIELAQRRAKQRDRSAISQAQRNAQLRYEKDLLDRIQGSWVDEADPSVSYVLNDGLCSVSGGDNSRTFRNRLSVYGGELCWDARRFWHNLNISALPPADEEVQRVEWNPAEGSPPCKQIVWVRAPPKPEGADDSEEDESKEAAEGSPSPLAEEVAEAAVA